ncbi:hypothetical protein V6L80_04195 [Erwinia persicina]|uniref:hypothetical protein n=1 Tax=Erwinia persicina TaxID=55211 RepID=UPI0030D21B14
MINLKHHLSNANSSIDQVLDDTVEALWAHLNIFSQKKQPAEKGIKRNAEKFKVTIFEDSHSAKYGKQAAKRHQEFMNHILTSDNLKQIIIAKPSQFQSIINQMNQILDDEDYNTVYYNALKIPSFSDLLLNNVFKYALYRDSLFCSSLYIGLNFVQMTCPYCNEYPVKIIERKNKPGTKPTLHFDLDHFYPKNRYPYLALSFYNHIPCCKYCNSLHKGDKLFSVDSHIHPWDRNFDELYSFSYSHDALRGHSVDDVKIIKNSAFDDALCTDLELEERYKTNIEYANINRLISILADYRYFIEQDSPCSDRDRDRLKERIADFGLVFSGSQILQRPWSKMQRDLVKFFDVNNILSLK